MIIATAARICVSHMHPPRDKHVFIDRENFVLGIRPLWQSGVAFNPFKIKSRRMYNSGSFKVFAISSFANFVMSPAAFKVEAWPAKSNVHTVNQSQDFQESQT